MKKAREKVKENLNILYVSINGATGKVASLKSVLESTETRIATVAETKLLSHPPVIHG